MRSRGQRVGRRGLGEKKRTGGRDDALKQERPPYLVNPLKLGAGPEAEPRKKGVTVPVRQWPLGTAREGG